MGDLYPLIAWVSCAASVPVSFLDRGRRGQHALIF